MRQAAEEKLGFYPCPVQAIEMIAEKVTADPEAIIVDPCAGEGEAVATLADLLEVPRDRIVACELEHNRSAKLAARLPEATLSLATDFQSSVFFRSRATVMWLNPPFANEVGYLGDRCEATFLARATEMLKPGGVLIMILPENRVPGIRLYIQNWYGDAQKFAFPAAHRNYREVAIIATKLGKPRADKFASHRTLEYPIPGAVYYAGKGERFEITKQAYTDEDLQDLLKVDLVAIQGATSKRDEIRPPLQLGQGHVALLLAAGHLNGRVEKEGEPPHVVRGTSRKVEETKSESSDGKEITTVTQEKIELVIRLAHPDGKIEDLANA